MLGARLEIAADGARANLQGSLNCVTVPDLWPQLQSAIQQQDNLKISLQQVESLNSAAVVLLLEARQLATQSAKNLTFTDIPASLENLARMSNVQDLL